MYGEMMGFLFRPIPVIAAMLLCVTAGCQMQPSFSDAGLLDHQAMLDWSGLGETQTIDSVKVNAALPQRWTAMALKHTRSCVQAQWRSPSRQTGVGVAYVRLPLPMPTSMLVWLAKDEYAKRGHDGEVIGQWTDSLGRSWFEAQNSKFHIRGYVVNKGFDAWFIYCGYTRTDEPPSAAELGVAARSLETIVPTPLADPNAPRRPLAYSPQLDENTSF